MTRYEVTRAFRDKLDNRRLYSPGDIYASPSEERARHLVSLGFIRPVEVDDPQSEPTSESAPAPERKAGRPRNSRRQKAAGEAGDAE